MCLFLVLIIVRTSQPKFDSHTSLQDTSMSNHVKESPATAAPARTAQSRRRRCGRRSQASTSAAAGPAGWQKTAQSAWWRRRPGTAADACHGCPSGATAEPGQHCEESWIVVAAARQGSSAAHLLFAIHGLGAAQPILVHLVQLCQVVNRHLERESKILDINQGISSDQCSEKGSLLEWYRRTRI